MIDLNILTPSTLAALYCDLLDNGYDAEAETVNRHAQSIVGLDSWLRLIEAHYRA